MFAGLQRLRVLLAEAGYETRVAFAASHGRGRTTPQGTGLHPDRHLELRGAEDRARPRRRAQGAPQAARAARAPPGPDARDDLPEAVDAHPGLVRGRHRRARRLRALPLRERPPARARRDDQGHGERPRALPGRDHDPHLRAGGRRAARRARRHPGDQRADRLRASMPGTRRPDDDPRAARPALRRAARLSRRRKQRLRLADGRRDPLRDAVRRRHAQGLRAGRERGHRGPAGGRADGRNGRARPRRQGGRPRGGRPLHGRLDEHGPGEGVRPAAQGPRRLPDRRRAALAREPRRDRAPLPSGALRRGDHRGGPVRAALGRLGPGREPLARPEGVCWR